MQEKGGTGSSICLDVRGEGEKLPGLKSQESQSDW